MVLIDSNIIIYAAQPQHQQLVEYLQEREVAVSKVSYLEVLGYHGLSAEDRSSFKEFFRHVYRLGITDPIIEQAMALKQQRRMSLGDSLIAATAMVHDLPLLTHNLRDFAHISDLLVEDPFDSLQ